MALPAARPITGTFTSRKRLYRRHLRPLGAGWSCTRPGTSLAIPATAAPGRCRAISLYGSMAPLAKSVLAAGATAIAIEIGPNAFMKVVVLDDYLDTVRTLACFGQLDGHDVAIWNDHVQTVDALAARLR